MGQQQVYVYDIESNVELAVIGQSGLQSITGMAVSPDNQSFVTVGAYPAYQQYSRQTLSQSLLWDIATGTFEVLENQDAGVSVAYSPDNTQIAIGGHDGYIYLYETETLGLENILFNDGNVARMTYSHDGRVLVTANGRYYRFWDMQELIVVNRLPDGFTRSPLYFSEDDERLTTGTAIFDVESNGQLVAVQSSRSSGERNQFTDMSDDELQRINGYLSQQNIRFDQPFWMDYTDDLIIIGATDGVIYLYGIREEGE